MKEMKLKNKIHEKSMRTKKISIQKIKIFFIWFSFIIIFLFTFNSTTFAESKVICLDSSGSMRINERIEAAKEAVIKEIERAKPGDKIWVVTFDTYARLLGKLEVGEGQEVEVVKQEIIKKISEIEALGPWTHLEQAVMKGKSLLLDEREFKGAKILIFSDGLSDPDPKSGVPPVNLEEMTNLVSKDLRIKVYLISFAEDIAGFFGSPIQSSGIVSTTSAPYIIGVPISSFSKKELRDAIKEIRKTDSKEVIVPKTKERSKAKKNKMPKKDRKLSSNILNAGLLGIGILAFFSLFAFFTQKKKKEMCSFILETEIEDEKQEFEVDLPEGKKKSVGSAGDIQVPNLEDLPPVLFSIQRKKGHTLIIPQDTIYLNGLQLTGISSINPGDVISVRDKLMFRISERGDENE